MLSCVFSAFFVILLSGKATLERTLKKINPTSCVHKRTRPGLLHDYIERYDWTNDDAAKARKDKEDRFFLCAEEHRVWKDGLARVLCRGAMELQE